MSELMVYLLIAILTAVFSIGAVVIDEGRRREQKLSRTLEDERRYFFRYQVREILEMSSLVDTFIEDYGIDTSKLEPSMRLINGKYIRTANFILEKEPAIRNEEDDRVLTFVCKEIDVFEGFFVEGACTRSIDFDKIDFSTLTSFFEAFGEVSDYILENSEHIYKASGEPVSRY